MKSSLPFCLIISVVLLSSLAVSQIVRVPVKKSSAVRSNSPNGRRFMNLNSKSGSIDIKNYANTQYLAAVTIGSNKKDFNVVLDTGSADLWIPDSSLSGSVTNSFDCTKSSTCVSDVLDIRSITYGKGAMQGYSASDQLDLGGVIIPQFEFLLAEEISGISTIYLDGIIGLSLGRNFPDHPTALERLKSDGLISVGTFSMYLGDEPSSSGGKTGEIIFGGYDPKYAASDFQFVNIKSSDETIFWSTDMIAIGYGTDVNISSGGSFPIIFDSGTSLLLLPQTIIDNLINNAASSGVSCSYNPFNGLYTCDCSAQKKLPNMVFYFQNFSLDISAESYVFSQYDGCYLGIQPMGGSPSLNNPAILGDVFLMNYYALYTSDNSTVGLAKAAPVKHFPVWGIILIVLGVVVIIIAGWYCYKRRKAARSNNTNSYTVFRESRGVAIGGR